MAWLVLLRPQVSFTSTLKKISIAAAIGAPRRLAASNEILGLGPVSKVENPGTASPAWQETPAAVVERQPEWR